MVAVVWGFEVINDDCVFGVWSCDGSGGLSLGCQNVCVFVFVGAKILGLEDFIIGKKWFLLDQRASIID